MCFVKYHSFGLFGFLFPQQNCYPTHFYSHCNLMISLLQIAWWTCFRVWLRCFEITDGALVSQNYVSRISRTWALSAPGACPLFPPSARVLLSSQQAGLLQTDRCSWPGESSLGGWRACPGHSHGFQSSLGCDDGQQDMTSSSWWWSGDLTELWNFILSLISLKDVKAYALRQTHGRVNAQQVHEIMLFPTLKSRRSRGFVLCSQFPSIHWFCLARTFEWNLKDLVTS